MKNEQISLQTKNNIANQLQEIMKYKDFHKISITDITQACDISRPTFYYHFHDIYEVLEYVFQNFLKDIFQPASMHNVDDWLISTLTYINDHKQVCLNAYHNIGYENLKHYLFPYTKSG